LYQGKYALFLKNCLAANNEEFEGPLWNYTQCEGVGSTDSFISFGSAWKTFPLLHKSLDQNDFDMAFLPGKSLYPSNRLHHELTSEYWPCCRHWKVDDFCFRLNPKRTMNASAWLNS
jgi:hypothetical protein